MTKSFTASNGWYIDEDGVLREANGRCVGYGGDVDRLGEFFQELRDHELGRWRSKDHPNFTAQVVGGSGDVIAVLNEGTSMGAHFERGHIFGTPDQGFTEVAHEYFAAHPQHKPLPTEPGLYANRLEFEELGAAATVIGLSETGNWYQPISDARAWEVAQGWHDAGELVRLVPEGGGRDE